MSRKTPVNESTIEMKISRLELAVILEKHLNTEILRTKHRVVEVITHKQGEAGVTVMIAPDEPDAQAKEVTSED